MSETHVLYRMFDRDDRLLYVGLTNNPKIRFRDHGKSKSWWEQVAKITLEHYSSRELLAAAEVRAIQREHPRYNIALVIQDFRQRSCWTCGSTDPKMVPRDEVILAEDGELIPFCTDPFHFPGEPHAERVHKNRDLLRQAGLLRLSEEAERRLERRRALLEEQTRGLTALFGRIAADSESGGAS